MPATMQPTVLVVFGATGDLMRRKVVPSLLYLRGRDMLPDELAVVGFSRRDWTDQDLRAHVRGILDECCPDADPTDTEEFLSLFRFHHGEFPDAAAYASMGTLIDQIESQWGVCPNRLFYLAVPPEHYATIFENLATSGLTEGCSDEAGWTRVLVEKPFGDDAETSKKLDGLLGSFFREEQIYRIDHYLAKEMLQGIINFRFQNNLFEGEWDRGTIERIDISLLEKIGVEKRGAFYDGIGALRDVGQNHILQMLALVTMERPPTPAADDIRDARADLIESLRPMTPGDVASDTFRAQHDGYTDIQGVDPESDTETYFKLRTTLTGPRWAGVPVTMQSGKRMGEPLKQIVVTFKRPKECFCVPGMSHQNEVVFQLEPNDSITISFYAKKPGFEEEVEERSFDFFLYERAEKLQYVEEYAKLLYDAFRGDQTLFVSTREVSAMWRFIDPIEDSWERAAVPLHSYPPDTASIAAEADEVLAAPGRSGQIAVCGLGKMGAGVARNLMDSGWEVVGWNRTHATAQKMAAEGLVAVETLAELAATLAPPRCVWLFVPSGKPVDEILFGDGGLASVLEAGDMVIDGGNSFYADDPERSERLAERGIRFMDCGVSGGPKGAREGACLMAGGDPADFAVLEQVFADIAVPGGYAYFGPAGSGHFVKMVHNGIEYGLMQAIAEGFQLMHVGAEQVGLADLDLEQVARVYQHRSVIESRLVGWLEEAYGELGDGLEGVSGTVGHTGEGAWTIQTAHQLGLQVPVMDASLQFRKDSEIEPSYAGQVLTALRNAFGGHGLDAGGGPRR